MELALEVLQQRIGALLLQQWALEAELQRLQRDAAVQQARELVGDAPTEV